MKLKKVIIHKYKSFTSKQELELENEITVLVGMNESGKTSILKAIANANYFQDDNSFKFNTTLDYPRKEKKAMEKSKEVPKAITCFYEIDNETLNSISEELGKNTLILNKNEFSRTTNYDNGVAAIDICTNIKNFWIHHILNLNIPLKIKLKLSEIKNSISLQKLIDKHCDDEHHRTLLKVQSQVEKYFTHTCRCEDPIGEYIYSNFLEPKIPKFLYYDEYYSLPSEIVLEELTGEPQESEQKTAKALIELANLDVNKIINSTDFDDYTAELEAA